MRDKISSFVQTDFAEMDHATSIYWECGTCGQVVTSDSENGTTHTKQAFQCQGCCEDCIVVLDIEDEVRALPMHCLFDGEMVIWEAVEFPGGEQGESEEDQT